MPKILWCVLVVTTVISTPIYSQQLTTVAIVDIKKVYDGYYHGGTTASLNLIREKYQPLITEQQDIIGTLNIQKREATRTNNADLVSDLNTQIQNAQNTIRELNSQQREEYDRIRLNQSRDVFIQNLQSAIIFVAESKGYSVVLRADNEGIQWWSPVVDITQEVLDRLIERY